jgi:hypothetical protein
MPYRLKYFVSLFFVYVLLFLILPSRVAATVTMDDPNAIYTDDFASNAGVPTKSYVNTNAGVLQLTSAASQSTFTTPYAASGNAMTAAIRPLPLAKWGTLTINATIPTDTTLKTQFLDDSNKLFSDTYIPGNSVGVEGTTIDISGLPIDKRGISSSTKPFGIKIKFLMTTSNTNATPTITDISFTWTRTQGDLSPTKIKNTHWPIYGIDQQRTYNTKSTLSGTYPTIKWSSDFFQYESYQYFRFDDYTFTVDTLANTYYWNKRNFKTNELVATLISAPDFATGVITENNTLYGNNFGNDIVYAYDINADNYKWVYNFQSGHGNERTLLRDDGTLYVIRQTNLEAGNKSKVFTLYAFNPDGTILFSQNYTELDYIFSFGFTFSIDQNTIYVATSSDDNSGVYQDYDASPTNNFGRLIAINADNGAEVWHYDTGNLINHYDFNPVVDTDGTIYVASRFSYSEDYIWPGTWPLQVRTKKLFAINPNGTLKWVRTTTDTGQGYKKLMLRSDGVLMALYKNNGSAHATPSQLLAINTSDGSVRWTRATGGTYTYTQFVDSLNGTVYNYQDSVADFYMGYVDKDNTLKWLIYYKYPGSNSYVTSRDVYSDADGNIYGTFKNLTLNQGKYYALGPWTLSVDQNGDSFNHGDTIEFTARTTMAATNTLLGGNNKIQVKMDNGDRVALTYSSTETSGETVWKGSYTVPDTYVGGEHTYAVEASQAHFQTDIPTNFNDPAIDTNNTGLSQTKTITIGAPVKCTDTKPAFSPNLYQVNVSNTTADLYFTPIVDPVTKYRIYYGTKESEFNQSKDVDKQTGGAIKVTVTGLAPNTNYFFKVSALNGCQESDSSQTLSTKTTKLGARSYYPGKPFTVNKFKSVNTVTNTKLQNTKPSGSPLNLIPTQQIKQKVNEVKETVQKQVVKSNILSKITSFFKNIFK